MTTPNDDLDRAKSENDLIERVEQLEKMVSGLFRENIEAISMDEVSSDLGEVRMGRFLATESDGDPTDPTFNGMFLIADTETFGTSEYHFGGVYQGELMFGGNSDTGRFDFIGGAAHIDNDGITANSTLKWFLKQDATNDSNTRTAKLGLALEEGGGTIPVWQLSYESPAGTEEVSNGGFETGDLTGWTATTETNCTWSVTSGYKTAGTYAALCVPSDESSTGVLTSDRTTGVASKSYTISGKILVGIMVDSYTAKIEVKWYDNTSGGSLLQTDLIGTTSSLVTNTTFSYESVVAAPDGALSFEIVLTSIRTSSSGVFVFDEISATAVTVNEKFWLSDTGIKSTHGIYPDTFQGGANQFRAYHSGGTEFEPDTRTINDYTDFTSGIRLGTSAVEAADGDYFVMNIPLSKGTYTFLMNYAKFSQAGKFDVYVDGTQYGATIDPYNGSTTYTAVATITSIAIAADGVHEIKILINGKNASSTDYRFVASRIMMYKTAD